MNILPFLLLLVAPVACLLSCQTSLQDSQTQAIRLHISPQHLPTDRIGFVEFNMLNYSEILMQSDSNNGQEALYLEFELPTPSFGNLKVGDISFPMYLKAGDEIEMAFQPWDATPIVTYSGPGAIANTYLAGSSGIVDRFYLRHPEFFRSDVHVFARMMDTLEQELAAYHQYFCDSSTLKKPLQKLFSSRNAIILLDLQFQFYEINHLAYVREDTLPDRIIHMLSSIPFDRRFSDLGMIEYARVLDLYLRAQFGSFFLKGKEGEERDSLINLLPSLTHDRILLIHPNAQIQELLCAKNLDYWLTLVGISPSLQLAYDNFQQAFPTSVFLPDLQKHYAEWNRISPGQPAPNIIGTTLQGDTLSLTDLKGQLVFVDVWASWCRPCIAEFSAYASLQAAFSQAENIQWLFVSIDKDSLAWKQAVSLHGNMEGRYIRELPNREKASIFHAYKLWGIPRYLLIDQAGRIVDIHAPSPSSGKLEEMIRKLL
ncbi:MAG: TlpA disulfide reductase family protein [Bacteroidota bacterium]